MPLTNFTINPNRTGQQGIMKAFGKDLEKAHVKAHVRKTKSGKMSQVKDYEDKRQKHGKPGGKWHIFDDDDRPLTKKPFPSQKHAQKYLSYLRDDQQSSYKVRQTSGPTSKPKGMHRFTDDDWDGFAGCEPFDDGTQPLIGETKVAGKEALIIWDKNGILCDLTDYMNFEGENNYKNPGDESWSIDTTNTRVGQKITEMLMQGKVGTVERLKDLGFKKNA